MPPKTKITREMIIDVAFAITRQMGIEYVNARLIATKLCCSTQPIMYHFATIDELKKAVYRKADEFHTKYLFNIVSDDPMKAIGINFIRFAATEKKLFLLLFQTDKFSGSDITSMIDSEELSSVRQILSQEAGVDETKAKEIFKILALFVYGYASIIANNTIEYKEEEIDAYLEKAFNGAVYAIKGE